MAIKYSGQCLLRWRARYLADNFCKINNMFYQPENNTDDFYLDLEYLIDEVKELSLFDEQKSLKLFELMTEPIADFISKGAYGYSTLILTHLKFRANYHIIEKLCFALDNNLLLSEINFKFNFDCSTNKDLENISETFKHTLGYFGYNKISVNFKINDQFVKHEAFCKTNILDEYFELPRLKQPYLNKDLQNMLIDYLKN